MARTSRSLLAACLLLSLAAVQVWRSSLSAFAGPGRASSRGSGRARATMGAHKDGLFTPVVHAAKVVLGEDNLKDIRAKAIKAHGEVMGKFIDTHDTPMGEFALRRLFDAADTDGNGTIEPDELEAAMGKLGFHWIDEKKTMRLVMKGDVNGDEVIDFEEFKVLAPTVLRQNLMILAKNNGGELGFLS